MIRALIFDCFGVLTTDSWLAFLDSLPPTADIARARELNRAYDAGLIDAETFFCEVEAVTGSRPPDIEQLFGGEVVKNVPLLDYIRELKADFLIGLLSNISSDWITRQFLTAAEQELFDQMVLSYEVGMTKPDPRVFMMICERLRVGPHEAVLIDDVVRNVTAARNEGLAGIVYQDLPSLRRELSALLDPQH